MSTPQIRDRASIELDLKQMLAQTSPLSVEDIDASLMLVELGLSSLQLQIFAARIEAAFEIRFGENEIGNIESFGALVAAVHNHCTGNA